MVFRKHRTRFAFLPHRGGGKRCPVTYRSLRDFIAKLEVERELVRVREPVSTVLEMTEIQTRLIAEGGPAVLFENVTKADGAHSEFPVLVNLFGTVKRVAMGETMGGIERRH